MESHVLNTYHRAYQYGIPRVASESSSEGSGAHASPEYPAGWGGQETKASSKISNDSDESSSDSEDVVPEHSYVQNPYSQQSETEYYHEVEVNSDDDYEVVVDDEPASEPVIVYAVDPNLDFDASDEEDELHIDAPVVSSVDEYFVKEVDEEYVKDVKEDVEYCVEKPASVMPEVLLDVIPTVDKEVQQIDTVPVTDVFEIAPEPEVVEKKVEDDAIPHIEHIKRFLLEDMPCPRLNTKPVQRSCSLPHSPAHFSYLDVDDARTSLSFEDLNIDLADFSFDDGKDKDSTDEAPRTLTEEDVNSFLITDKKTDGTDDLSQQDMEIDGLVETKLPDDVPLVASAVLDQPMLPELKVPETELLDIIPQIAKVPVSPLIELKAPEAILDIPDDLVAPVTPIKSNVLEFCVEKTIKVKEEVKTEVDDFVDVESFNDAVMPVLEATNVSSLLEQFEATEKLNKVKKKEKSKNGLANGTRLQEAAVHLNKNKMRHILMSNGAVAKKSQVHSDHDYCSPKKRHSLPAVRSGQSLLRPDVLSSNNRIINSRHRSCKNKKIVYNLSSDEEGNKPPVKPSVTPPLHSNHRKKLSSDPPVKASTVITNKASKASDNVSHIPSGSVKLTIKNKSKVILNFDCQDVKVNEVKNCVENVKIEKPLDGCFNKSVNDSIGNTNPVVVEEDRPQKEDFYTALFNDKKGVHITLPEPLIVANPPNEKVPEVIEIKPQKKKLNLQEYKMRREGNSNTNSRTVSPEAIFPELQVTIDKTTPKADTPSPKETEPVKIERNQNEIFDPIKEASRKILMNTKKHKAEALRKRDEDIVMSKIPKVENLELEPLISDAEMMQIAGLAPEILPKVEKKVNSDYVEIVLVSVGTNTDENIFKELRKTVEIAKPKVHDKSGINFKIGRKTDSVLRQNVFESTKKDRSPTGDLSDRNNKEQIIDKERFKDITATIKSVEMQVVKKISSNSLFASIQDVVMKKAAQTEKSPENERKTPSPVKRKTPLFKDKSKKTEIVCDFDKKTEHGEDKIILHLEKDRKIAPRTNINVQTDIDPEFPDLSELMFEPEETVRIRVDSDKSTTSDVKENRSRSIERPKSRVRSKSRSNDRYERYRRRSRSGSRRRRRTRSRSIDYRRRRRSVSPYRKKRSRSPYRRRNYRSRSKSQVKSRSPVPKKSKVPEEMQRKPTISESSDSSTSSSSSSESDRSRSRSRRSVSPPYRKAYRRSYSSDDSNKPVEERRIVFVGKLEQDMTKSGLRSIFSKYGPIMEVTLHTKENGLRYGFVTFRLGRDAWAAVAAAADHPQYDVGFGGRRAFCRQRYADLDGMEAEYSDGYHAPAPQHDDDMSFEQMLMEMKKKLSQRK